MSDLQIRFLKGVCGLPLADIRREFNQRGHSHHQQESSKLIPSITGVHIYHIQEEQLFLTSTDVIKVNRVFASLPNDNIVTRRHRFIEEQPYRSTGWIVNENVQHCMICKLQFSFLFSFKHHCRACGNLVCHQCSDSMMIIEEIRESGKLRVCRMCDFGQVMSARIPLTY